LIELFNENFFEEGKKLVFFNKKLFCTLPKKNFINSVLNTEKEKYFVCKLFGYHHHLKTPFSYYSLVYKTIKTLNLGFL